MLTAIIRTDPVFTAVAVINSVVDMALPMRYGNLLNMR